MAQPKAKVCPKSKVDRYTGMREPRCGCFACWDKYRVTQMRLRKKVSRKRGVSMEDTFDAIVGI